MYLVVLLMAASELILSTRVCICDLLIQLLQTNFHMSMNKGYTHGGMLHHLLISIDSLRAATETSIRFVEGINLYHMTTLGSAGDLHFRQSPVTLAFLACALVPLSFLNCLDLVNHNLSSLSGPCYPDDRSPMSYSGPPREPAYPNNRWDFPPRPMNHRHFNYRPSSEGPVPVANRGMESIPIWHTS